MGAKMKIERELLTFLLKIKVQHNEIQKLLGVSKATLYKYLQKHPITEDEFNAINTDRDNLVGYFWQYIINNRVNYQQNANFRLPENNVQKQKVSQMNRIEKKSSSVKSVKEKTGLDELDIYMDKLQKDIVDG